MKVFLDFGCNQGQGLRELARQHSVDDSWTIETFEPNTDCDVKSLLSEFKNITINQAAIWTHTGTVQFSKMNEDSQGSSVECIMSEGICQDPSSNSFRRHDNVVEVPCVDVTDVLNRYKNAEYVVVKMDIEGSEFNVLRKAISDGSIGIAKVLYVEWHQTYVKGESINSVDALKLQLANMGIQVHDWR